MNWKAVVSLSLLLIASSAGSRAQIHTSLRLDELNGQLMNGVNHALKNADQTTVGLLTKDLADLSGLENALAVQIENLAKIPHDWNKNEQVIYSPNSKLREIQTKFAIIRSRIDSIDPSWAFQNAMLQVNLGKFAHDGILFYEPPNGSAITISDPQNARELADQLWADVVEIGKIAQSLQISSVQPAQAMAIPTAPPIPTAQTPSSAAPPSAPTAQPTAAAAPPGSVPVAQQSESPTVQNINIAMYFGISFILFLFMTAIGLIFFPRQVPPEAMWILRVILALAGAGLGAGLSGMLLVNFAPTQGLTIQAASGFALFVLIYLVNPPEKIRNQVI